MREGRDGVEVRGGEKVGVGWVGVGEDIKDNVGDFIGDDWVGVNIRGLWDVFSWAFFGILGY